MFKNTPFKGVKNIIARVTMKEEDRMKAYLEDYKNDNPDWYAGKTLLENRALLFGDGGRNIFAPTVIEHKD